MQNDDQHDWKTGSYRYPLDTLVRDVIGQWRADRDSCLMNAPEVEEAVGIVANETDPIGGTPYSKADLLTGMEQFVESLMIVAMSPGAASCGINDGIVGLTGFFPGEILDHVEESLQSQLTDKVVTTAAEAAHRLLSLSHRLCQVDDLQLPASVGDFLRLVMRSYIWGFDTECIILCRSALEQALQKQVTYDMCVSRLGPRGVREHCYNFLDHLQVARKEGLLNDRLVKVADEIRERGDAVLHKDAKLTETVDDTIRGTVRVIYALTEGRDPQDLPWWDGAAGFPPP